MRELPLPAASAGSRMARLPGVRSIGGGQRDHRHVKLFTIPMSVAAPAPA